MYKKFLATMGFIGITLISGQAGASPAILAAGNLGFESGLGGYLATPGVNVVTSATALSGNTYYATEGKYFAQLTPNSQQGCALLGGDTCAALITMVSMEQGNTLSFDFAFLATDFFPFNDFALFVGDDLYTLADVVSVGDEGDSGWQTFSWTASSDFTGPIAWISSNAFDGDLSPDLLVDNIHVVPEPASLALLGLGLLGLAFGRRKRATSAV